MAGKYHVTLRRVARTPAAELARLLADADVDMSAVTAEELERKLLAVAAARRSGAADAAKRLLEEAGVSGGEVARLVEAGVVPALDAADIASLIVAAAAAAATGYVPLRAARQLYSFIAGNCLVSAGWPDVLLAFEDYGVRDGDTILLTGAVVSKAGAAAEETWRIKVSLEFMAELARRAKQIFPVAP